MASLSNTYLFGTNTQVDDLFREAYERIGIIGNAQTPLNVQSALMSANLELSSWPGKGLNLWLVKRNMVTVNENQAIYPLPINTVRILEVVASQTTRLNIGGVASSTEGGNADNCFDPSSSAGCIQTSPNGSIAYDYGANNPTSIFYVGVTSLNKSTYTISVEYSFDNINWETTYVSPSQVYFPTQTTWFVIDNSVNARSWRITETGGATLAIQQIYFNQPPTFGPADRALKGISRSEWMTVSNKLNTGFPSGYYFDQQINSNITLWPVPGPGTLTAPTNLLYTTYQYAQDVTQMFQSAEVPQRFLDALVSGIATRLALKFAPDRYPLLKQEAGEAYAIAANTDYENVSLMFTPDFTSYLG